MRVNNMGMMQDRSSFRWDDEEQIEAKCGNKCFWIAAAAGVAASLYGASQSKKAGEEAEELMLEGGALSKSASYANAADVEGLGSMNAGAITGAAQNNAAMMRDIGYANGIAIADATLQNLNLYKIQSDEEVKLHRRGERWHAGEIRAQLSSTGVMVNSGSPMAYLQSEVQAGIQERHYMQQRDAYTMLSMADDGVKQTLLTVKEANYNAQVTQQNASLQAGVAMAEATAQAAAMRRQGDISAQVGVANGQAARAAGSSAALSAIGSAAGYAGKAYSSWKATQSSYQAPSYANYNTSASWT